MSLLIETCQNENAVSRLDGVKEKLVMEASVRQREIWKRESAKQEQVGGFFVFLI
jgi:hypothetical protein